MFTFPGPILLGTYSKKITMDALKDLSTGVFIGALLMTAEN